MSVVSRAPTPCPPSFEDENMLPPYSPRNPFRLVQIENPWSPPARRWACVKTTKKVTQGAEITDDIIAECSKLLNANLGVWGELARRKGSGIASGSPAGTSVISLRAKCIPCEEGTTLVRVYIQDKLVGYAFGTRWPHHNLPGAVCWITQVVVDRNYRGVGLATALLSKFKTNKDVLYGIISSHPAAIMALKRAVSGSGLSYYDLLYTRLNARDVLQESTIKTLKGTVLRGAIFNDPSCHLNDNGIVCCVEKTSILAHDDALCALRYLEQRGRDWEFGQLRDGLEFIALVKNGDWKEG